MRGDTNFDASKYTHAVEMFLTVYPDRTTRKRGRHLDGHRYPESRRKTSSKKQHTIHDISVALDNQLEIDINDINVDDISDDDWSSSDSEDA